MLSAGELGTQPSAVDKALNKALKMCHRWGAMLLLDEADVFLGKGSGGQEAGALRDESVSSKSTSLTSPCSLLFPHASTRPHN